MALLTAAGRGDENLKSLVKLVSILDAFSTNARSLSLADLCQRTGYPKSTVHRLLSSLRDVGLLDQDMGRDRYRLGLKLFELGNTVLANMEVHREARPFVDMLGQLTGLPVHLAVFDGHHIIVVARSDSLGDAATRGMLESAPAHCTSVGKAILAHLPTAALDRFIDGGLARFTETTLANPDTLRDDLERTRERGYAIDEGEHRPGLHCVGAPIYDASGRVFAAMSVSAPSYKLPLSEVDAVAKIVMFNAQGVSRALGHSPSSRISEL